MITDRLLLWLATLVDVDAPAEVESWTLPGWVDSASGYAGTVFAYAGSLGAWVNFGLLGVVAGSVFTSVLVGFGIKTTRLGVGFVTRRSV